MTTQLFHEPILRTEIVQVGPALAAEWLQGHINYRSLSKERVTLYARDMTAGKWELNGAAIQFDRNGLLVDGQHRLTAIIKSKCTVPMLIVWGVDSANNIDTGRKRSLRDLIRNSEFKNYGLSSTIIAKAPAMIGLMGKQCGIKLDTSRTINEQLNFAKQNKRLIEAASTLTYGMDRCYSLGRLGTVIFLGLNIEEDMTKDFVRSLRHQQYLNEHHPCVTLRKTLSNAKIRKGTVNDTWECAILIKAYNAYVTDQLAKIFRFTLEEKFPEIIGLDKLKAKLGM